MVLQEGPEMIVSRHLFVEQGLGCNGGSKIIGTPYEQMPNTVIVFNRFLTENRSTEIPNLGNSECSKIII